MEHCLQEIATNNWKDYFPLLSPIVVILLFSFERILSYNIRKREIARTWYYKVLIDPSLQKINDFFQLTQNYYVSSCKTLSASNNLPHADYNSLRSSEIGKFQQAKRAFDIDVVTPINHRYPKIGEMLQNKLMDLEDKFSTGIDKELFSQDEIDAFLDKVSEARAIWLNILYEPIR